MGSSLACLVPTVTVPLTPVLLTGFGVRHSVNNHSETKKKKKYICKTTGLNTLPWLFQVANTIGKGLARANTDRSSKHLLPLHFSSHCWVSINKVRLVSSAVLKHFEELLISWLPPLTLTSCPLEFLMAFRSCLLW